MKLFILEDEAAMLAALTTYCQNSGYEVASWNEGSQAAQKIIAAQPDLLVLDHLLPGKTGTEVLHQVRDQKLTMPAILITNSPLEDFQRTELEYLDIRAVIPKAQTSLAAITITIGQVLSGANA